MSYLFPCTDCNRNTTWNCHLCGLTYCKKHLVRRADPCSYKNCNGTATCPSCRGGNKDFTFCAECSHIHDEQMDAEAKAEAEREARKCTHNCQDWTDYCAKCAAEEADEAEQDATLDLVATLDLCDEDPRASRACAECGKSDDIVEFTDCPHNAAGPCTKNCPPVTLLCRGTPIKRS